MILRSKDGKYFDSNLLCRANNLAVISDFCLSEKSVTVKETILSLLFRISSNESCAKKLISCIFIGVVVLNSFSWFDIYVAFIV